MTLSDLERREARGQIFQADLRNNACTVGPRTTKFGRITRVREGRILGQPRPYRKGAWPQRSPILGFLLFMHTPFDAELPNDVVTHMVRGLVFRGQQLLTTRGRGPSAPQFWGFFCIMPISFNAERPNSACPWRGA